MSATEFGTNIDDVPQFKMSQLEIIGKSPSPDFIPDEESASICPLLTPSPTGADFRHPLDPSSEHKMMLDGKSPSPDFTQDEEAALITSSPPSFCHPLDPLRSLAYERQNTPSSMDTEITGISQPAMGGSDVQYVELEQSSRENRSISAEGEDAQGSFPAQARNSVPSELLESSASSSSFALQENNSCVQLLGNHHYQHLNVDKMNDVAAFISQSESCNKQSGIDLDGTQSPPDYCFLTWNWPLIRKFSFWTVMSTMVACFCVVVGTIATTPRRCYPPHEWYQGSVFYEIFPASFQDSGSDGIGDLRGIVMRAEYFSRIGAQVVRLNSIFPSTHYPENFENVTNLTDVERSLGTLKDFSYLLEVLHKRNISLVLDFPLYPYVKDLGEMKISIKNGRKDVADKITNVVHNHRSHRSAENETDSEHEGLSRNEFSGRKRLLKPYIDGGIAGFKKSNSENVNLVPQTAVEEALNFWFDLGIDGVYFKGLENYVKDGKFLAEVEKWNNIKEKYRLNGENKMLMCDFEVLETAEDEKVKDVILTTMDLLDIYLDLSNGTHHIYNQIKKCEGENIYDRYGNPWIHWNIGNVETKRLASKVTNHLGAIMFQYLLPGTISIFYGDEIGLRKAADRNQEHSDVKHVHQVPPMNWDRHNGTGFTQSIHLPWIPYSEGDKNTAATEIILANMTRLRNDAPSIYMTSVWKENESLINYAFRYVDGNLIVMERSYPRRNAYIVVYNAGKEDVRNDLSSIYYGGEVMVDTKGNSGIYVTFNNFTLNSGEAYVVKLDK